MTNPQPAPVPPPAKRRSRGRAALVMIGKVVLVLVGIRLVIAALRSVDWAQVGDALGRLTWLELLVIAVIVGIRQFVNSSTLSVLLPGLPLQPCAVDRAVRNGDPDVHPTAG